MISNRYDARRVLLAAGAGFLFCLSVAGPAAAQSSQWNALYDRIIRLEHQLRAMQGQKQGAGAGQQQPSGNTAYRLGELEERLRVLSGRVVALTYQVEQMRKELQKRSGKLQRPTQPQAPKTRQQARTQTPPSLQPPVFQDQSAISGFDMSTLPSNDPNLPQEVVDGTEPLIQFNNIDQNGRDTRQIPPDPLPSTSSAQGAQGPQVLGQLRIPQSGQGPTVLVEPQRDPSLVPDRVETATLSSPSGAVQSAEALYKSSYQHLLGRRFGLAEAGFKSFVERYGKHGLASNAHYWLGETYYTQGRYTPAAQSFLTGYRRYPRGKKAPDTLLKLGMSLQRLGQKPQACSAYSTVISKYPRSKSVRSLAAKEQRRAGC